MSTEHLKVIDAPLTDLHVSGSNPRTITRERLHSLQRSLREQPDLLRARPVIALPDGEVIAGNMRLLAAHAMGWETIPAVYMDLTPQEARTVMLVDNASFGEWDPEMLAGIVFDLREQGADLELTGLDEAEIGRLLASVAPDGGEPEPPADADPALIKCPQCGHQWEKGA